MRLTQKALLAVAMLTASSALSSLALAERDIRVVGAIGDSITTGFNSRGLGDNRALSWATGSSRDVMSHLRRLQMARSSSIEGYNEAVAGSVAADLDRQITQLLRRDPDYVTVAIGANDVCSWTEDYLPALAAYEETLRRSIQRLVEARPSATIYMAAIPDMYNLYEVASQRSQCRAVWSLAGVCRPLLGRNVTDLQRQGFVQRWQAANEAITQVASEFPDNVRHDPALSEARFEMRHISTIDCFHPSVEGQNLMAELSWRMVLEQGGF